ncbi:ATP-binding protein [Kitasatospora sp. NPDC093806]|uniref:sensor histidine kinase n=1 Tax=Kitasatospora sp. NPDC093806 TaxID=3155075 RepID=UPI00343CF08E
MPGISAPRTGHRAGRSGSLRSSLLALALVPSLGLAAAWGYAAYLLRDAGDRTALYGGSAVVAVVLLWSLIRGVRLARTVPARISGLHSDTLVLAQHEIPQVVSRLQAGESLPTPPAWAPPRRIGDELQQTSDGLAAVRQAAVAAIIHQAQGREGTKKVFLNIARRTQILIHRQISMLDALEREHEEPELLRELFAVDHLATRMRRNAENLVILGGALPARRWRNAVPMVNVLRSAVSETENYARVVVQGVPRASLSGQAVADVIHLVAELIENGTTFSPPYTQVQVSAQEVPKGLAVEVEDRGLGMGEDEYERLNDYLANPPELDVSALGDDLRLGLFVVARLAARHDIQVTLRPSPYGGTRAVVLVPALLLEQPEQPASLPGLPAGARVTRTPVPEPLPGTGPDADLGEIDEELSGALAGVLSGLLGSGPTPEATGTGAGAGAGSGVGAGVGSGVGAGVGSGVSGPVAELLAPGGGLLGGGLLDGGLLGGAADGGTLDGSVVIGELLARYPMGGSRSEDDPTVNGGLPVGSPIPGLPGAVVVPRPALPRPYDESAGGPGPDGALAAAAADGGPAGAEAEVSSDGSGTPTHQRAEEAPLDHGPDGELRTPRVLPQRVRNASLAEQLREAHAPGAAFGQPGPYGQPAAPAPYGPPGAGGLTGPGPYGQPAGRPVDDASPQRSRATMAAIQRGTRTARAAAPDSDAPAAPPAPAAPSAAKEQQ